MPIFYGIAADRRNNPDFAWIQPGYRACGSSAGG